MRILAVVQGEYGRRIVKNIREVGPESWQVEVFEAPRGLPMVIDFPDRFLPQELPQADLLLSLGENSGVADLITAIAKRTGAKAVIAPTDNTSWLPPGLANQLKRELAALGIAAVFPKPFCTLTETSYSYRRAAQPYDDLLIAEFARRFGRPRLRISVDPASKTIERIEVLRGAPCGSTRFVAEGLVSIGVDNAEYEAGMLHAHYPCLASMATEQIDLALKDTLMHVSGYLTRDEVGERIRPFKAPPRYAATADLNEASKAVEREPAGGNGSSE